MEYELQSVASSVMRTCLGVRPQDDVAIVCDTERLDIADAIAVVADELEAKTTMLIISERFRRTKTIREPSLSEKILEALKDFDVIVLLLAQIAGELPFRKKFLDLIEKGTVRIANLPGITKKTFIENIRPPDRNIIEKRGNEVAAILRRAQRVRVTSPSGTDISFDLYQGNVRPEISSGFILQPSTWANLPGAEVYVAPKAWSAVGKIVIDCTFPRGHLLKAPISFNLNNGRVDPDSIQSTDDKAVNLLTELISNPNGDALAEFGIGLNTEIKEPTGIVLIDEKKYGTAHFALGDNVIFGGEIESKDHFDMVFMHPSIWIDGDQIMKDGEFTYNSKILRNNYKQFPGTIDSDTFIRAVSRISCKRSNGDLMLIWRGGANRLHAYKIGDEETSPLITEVWGAIDHGGNYICSITKRTGLTTKIVAKIVELMVGHRILEVAERSARTVETLEDMLKTKKYESVEALEETKKRSHGKH